ncbi:MAG: DUF2190 family protein [Syntrophobacterales bacterium]|jgi:hypothetical protein|nr:DUF2190 family protein [Syntrophobacterales bacterium]
MIGQTSGIEKSVNAGAAITAYTIGKFGANDNTMIPATSNADLMFGVFQHDAGNGSEVRVMLTGISRLKIGAGGIVRGSPVTADASGQGVAITGAAGTNVQSIGIAMATGNAGDIVPVLIAPSRPQQ